MAEWRFLLDENIDPKVATYLETEDLDAEHVRDTLGLGADDEDILSHAHGRDRIVVTNDVADVGSLPDETHASVVLPYDDTLPAYRVVSALIPLVDAYFGRAAFGGRDVLDRWT